MSAAVANKPVKYIGIFSMVVGVIMMIAGAAVYIYASNMLREQNMTVSTATADNPGRFAGKPVAGPFTAMGQANAINVHALAATDGLSYAELGGAVRAATGEFAELVDNDEALIAELQKALDFRNPMMVERMDVSDEAMAAAEKALDLQYQRMGSAINGSLLQGALFTSVMAFGVAVLVMGVGLMFVLFGWVFTKVAPAAVAPKE